MSSENKEEKQFKLMEQFMNPPTRVHISVEHTEKTEISNNVTWLLEGFDATTPVVAAAYCLDDTKRCRQATWSLPHPLQDTSRFILCVQRNADPRQVVSDAIQRAMADCDALIKAF